MVLVFKKIVNVDGNLGKDVVLFFYSVVVIELRVWKYDYMSVVDWFKEIGDDLMLNERVCVEVFVFLCSGGIFEMISFYEFLYWWVLCEYLYEGCINYFVYYKFYKG